MTFQIFDNMQECTDDEVARLLPLVSPQRRDQALQYRYPAGRYACLKSYRMLCDLIHADSPPLFGYNEYGKPYLKDHPDIHFSISHCPLAIAVAVSDKPIGIDIERFHDPDDALLQRTMNPGEIAEIMHADNRAEAFTMLWTQKEAMLKAQGTGIIDDLTHCRDAQPCVSSTHSIPEKQYCWSIFEIISEN